MNQPWASDLPREGSLRFEVLHIYAEQVDVSTDEVLRPYLAVVTSIIRDTEHRGWTISTFDEFRPIELPVPSGRVVLEHRLETNEVPLLGHVHVGNYGLNPSGDDVGQDSCLCSFTIWRCHSQDDVSALFGGESKDGLGFVRCRVEHRISINPQELGSILRCGPIALKDLANHRAGSDRNRWHRNLDPGGRRLRSAHLVTNYQGHVEGSAVLVRVLWRALPRSVAIAKVPLPLLGVARRVRERHRSPVDSEVEVRHGSICNNHLLTGRRSSTFIGDAKGDLICTRCLVRITWRALRRCVPVAEIPRPTRRGVLGLIGKRDDLAGCNNTLRQAKRCRRRIDRIHNGDVHPNSVRSSGVLNFKEYSIGTGLGPTFVDHLATASRAIAKIPIPRSRAVR